MVQIYQLKDRDIQGVKKIQLHTAYEKPILGRHRFKITGWRKSWKNKLTNLKFCVRLLDN